MALTVGSLGAAPSPGISARCFTPERERLGPGDYKIWHTSRVTADSVGRGWSIPPDQIEKLARERVNQLADELGYVRVDATWSVADTPRTFGWPTCSVSRHGGPRKHPSRRSRRRPPEPCYRVPSSLISYNGASCGSYGSRLHRADDGSWVAYARWPDDQTRQDCQHGETEGARLMGEAIAERLPEITMELVSDLLAEPEGA